jgi:predicted nucleotidyltransferase
MRRMEALPVEITERLDAVRALCEKYSVRRLTLFGSAVKGTFDPKRSDVDFLVEFECIRTLWSAAVAGSSCGRS